jgi:hypothetical protein
MPVVPGQGMNFSAEGQSPLQTQAPSESNLLMAAAEMHRQGRLVEDPARSMPQGPGRFPNPAKARGARRKLKVVK